MTNAYGMKIVSQKTISVAIGIIAILSTIAVWHARHAEDSGGGSDRASTPNVTAVSDRAAVANGGSDPANGKRKPKPTPVPVKPPLLKTVLPEKYVAELKEVARQDRERIDALDEQTFSFLVQNGKNGNIIRAGAKQMQPLWELGSFIKGLQNPDFERALSNLCEDGASFVLVREILENRSKQAGLNVGFSSIQTFGELAAALKANKDVVESSLAEIQQTIQLPEDYLNACVELVERRQRWFIYRRLLWATGQAEPEPIKKGTGGIVRSGL
jgi:hypothetical protein